MTTLDISEILRLLPHRYPFLLIDKVNHIEPHHSIEAVKNVSINEPFFQGHFPGKAIMPGVLLIEAIAQAAGVLYFYTHGTDSESLFVLAGTNKVRFKKPVVPGDQLLIQAKIEKMKGQFAVLSGQILVDGQIVCTAEILMAKSLQSAL